MAALVPLSHSALASRRAPPDGREKVKVTQDFACVRRSLTAPSGSGAGPGLERVGCLAPVQVLQLLA
eukprot:975528-Alexandrium_andersonii.AAC.1